MENSQKIIYYFSMVRFVEDKYIIEKDDLLVIPVDITLWNTHNEYTYI